MSNKRQVLCGLQEPTQKTSSTHIIRGNEDPGDELDGSVENSCNISLLMWQEHLLWTHTLEQY